MKKLVFIILLAALGCKPKMETKEQTTATDSTKTMSSIQKSAFGKLADGQEVTLYTLINEKGIELKAMNYGGIITALKTQDKNGLSEDIVLGYDSLAGYLKETPYLGAIVGRYGNRIAKGKFTLDGKAYKLAVNNDLNSLHGGLKGFDKVLWSATEAMTPDGPSITFSYLSKDMEEGFPGNLQVEVKYTLTNNNELKLDYKATTDKATVVNLTQHSYFNLAGNAKRDILEHTISINADQFIPIDKTLIPTGKLQSVEGTPFDFRTMKAMGKQIDDKEEQIEFAGGYDHCFVLKLSTDSLNYAASIIEPVSGRKLDVYTAEPGIQFYTGNFLDGTITGKHDIVYNKRFGFCLETEHFPDSPNQKQFPSVVLKPGEVYKTSTVYKFSNL